MMKILLIVVVQGLQRLENLIILTKFYVVFVRRVYIYATDRIHYYKTVELFAKIIDNSWAHMYIDWKMLSRLEIWSHCLKVFTEFI